LVGEASGQMREHGEASRLEQVGLDLAQRREVAQQDEGPAGSRTRLEWNFGDLNRQRLSMRQCDLDGPGWEAGSGRPSDGELRMSVECAPDRRFVGVL